jgi:regulator of sigma E protease
MVATILLSIFTLSLLILLHELGHFYFAKKFGVKVEEFGMFLPPRIWGKKIGETIYSINWIPFGGFVKMQGEDDNAQKDEQSFASKPIWQRAIIIAAGVVSFWLISIVILSGVFMSGAVEAVDDTDPATNARVQIVSVVGGSPAFSAGIKVGDIVKNIKAGGELMPIDKVAQVQEAAADSGGHEMILEIDRAGNVLEIALVPRENPPAGEGAMGVGLMRTAQKSYSFFSAIGNGAAATWRMTLGVFDGWGQIIGRLVKKEGMPPGAELVGPIGIVGLMSDQAQMGWNYYLQFVAMISVYLAVLNALPIPALDGGRLIFLALEAIRRKPVSEKIEQSLTAVCYGLLMVLMLFVIVKDIIRLF